MFDPEVAKLAKVIWDYLRMNKSFRKADMILVLGGHDLRVPAYAAELYTKGTAPIVVVSGGHAHHDDLLRTGWPETEAEKFAVVLEANGVPHDVILLENEAENTGDNFVLSKKLLDERHIAFRSVIVVTKPYMERRAYATGMKRWPDKEIAVTSPQISFEDYFGGYVNQQTTPENILNIMVGDLQRIDVYGRNGFQIPQEIPDEVWMAFNRLKKLGFTKHVLNPKVG